MCMCVIVRLFQKFIPSRLSIFTFRRVSISVTIGHWLRPKIERETPVEEGRAGQSLKESFWRSINPWTREDVCERAGEEARVGERLVARAKEQEEEAEKED